MIVTGTLLFHNVLYTCTFILASHKSNAFYKYRQLGYWSPVENAITLAKFAVYVGYFFLIKKYDFNLKDAGHK